VSESTPKNQAAPNTTENGTKPAPGDAETLAQGERAGASPASVPEIPGYEILEELGRGGMGVVYKARQISLKRLVALKMILAGAHASPEELARFRREAEAVAELQHPNIVQIHEVGEQAGRPFFSLEYVDGGSLAQRLAGQPQPAHWSAQLVQTVAGAVHAAHQHGIIHRDIKPGNILLTKDGLAKITDFGLAKRLDGAAEQTKSGSVLGTPSYMAPEQARSRQASIGPRTDIYALGAILYELITGQPPFRAASPLDTLLEVAERDPIRPRAVNPAVPRDLETICQKAMAKEASRRYASADEMAQDLGRFLRGEPIQARPIGAVERFWRRCRRNPALAGLSALAATLIITVAVLLATKMDRAAPDESLARVQRAGSLMIATDPTYPPLEFKREGDVAGFDIDLGRHIAGRLGVTAKFVAVEWDWQNLVKRLNAHHVDMLLSAVTVTEDRRQQVDFAEYERLPQVFLCRQGALVQTEQDLAGRVVAVQTDTTAHQLVVGLKRKGIAIKQVLVFPGADEPFDAVAGGQADVTLAHEPVARHYAKRHPRLTGPVGLAVTPDQVGIALCKQDHNLHRAVAEAIRAMKEDGTLANLRQTWFGP
jgi:ABC-type amino acid transport substrate-binding protein